MASRLISDKGVNEYIGAIKYLKNKNFNAKFYLAGNIDVNNPSRIDRSKFYFGKKINLFFSKNIIKKFQINKKFKYCYFTLIQGRFSKNFNGGGSLV